MNLSLESQPGFEAEGESYFDPKQRPVDLTHLCRYTMGNSALEREVLELFRRQTRVYFNKLSAAQSEEAWQEAARVLKGSARSVGAWPLLRTAETAEQLGDATSERRTEILRVMANQIDDANQFIDGIL